MCNILFFCGNKEEIWNKFKKNTKKTTKEQEN